MSRHSFRLALTTFVGLTLVVSVSDTSLFSSWASSLGPTAGLVPSSAFAQDGVSPEELGDFIEAKVESLRNGPRARRDEAHALALAQQLLNLNDARAVRGLGDVLQDSSVPLSTVRQVIVAALIDPEKRLLPAVVNRLLQDRDSDFDTSLDEALRVHADTVLVRKLAALAQDPTQRESLRVEAARTLGRTAEPAALDPLVKLWGSANQLMRRTAAAAFQRVMPVGFTSREEAEKALADLRRRGLTPWDLLTEKLAERGPQVEVPRADIEREHLRFALSMVGQATLDQLLTLYLKSRMPELRRPGIARIAGFQFDGAADPESREAARRKAGLALLTALPTETDTAAREALYLALNSLVAALKDVPLSEEQLQTIVGHARPNSGEPSATRRSAIRLLGELRDGRALEPLQALFDDLGDADWTTRKAVLVALDQIAPKRLLGWYIARLPKERHETVADALIQLIGASRDPAAVEPLRKLLSVDENQKLRWTAARELGKLWGSSGFAGARAALLEVALIDKNRSVRMFAADALSQGGEVESGNRDVLLALQQRVENDDDKGVREAAARSILALDAGGGVAYLKNSFIESDNIWSLYRQTVVDEAIARGTPARALVAANALADSGQPQLLARAFSLLEAMANARGGADVSAALWTVGTDRPIRGVVRSALARLFIEHGRPADALPRLEELLNVSARQSDPRAEWLWLTARALRQIAEATPERRQADLARARTLLTEARAAADLDVFLRGEILLQLALVELAAGRPAAARTVLHPSKSTAPHDVAALEGADAERRDALRQRADVAYRQEADRVLGWLDAGFGTSADADARRQFMASAGAAVRHLRPALAAEKDLPRVGRMIRAAAALTGETFSVALTPETTLESLQPTIKKALAALDKRAP